MKIYTIYDSKVESFGTPFFFKSKGDAIRGFTEVSNDTKTQIGKYPADFTLFEMGEYDELTGKFRINSTPTSIGIALEFAKNSSHATTHVSDSAMAVVT